MLEFLLGVLGQLSLGFPELFYLLRILIPNHPSRSLPMIPSKWVDPSSDQFQDPAASEVGTMVVLKDGLGVLRESLFRNRDP